MMMKFTIRDSLVVLKLVSDFSPAVALLLLPVFLTTASPRTPKKPPKELLHVRLEESVMDILQQANQQGQNAAKVCVSQHCADLLMRCNPNADTCLPPLRSEQ